jgi:hypothetical protein
MIGLNFVWLWDEQDENCAGAMLKDLCFNLKHVTEIERDLNVFILSELM